MENNIILDLIDVLIRLVVLIVLPVLSLRVKEWFESKVGQSRYDTLMQVVLDLMKAAEVYGLADVAFKFGSDKKSWVIDRVTHWCEARGWNVDLYPIAEMIESNWDMYFKDWEKHTK